MNARSFLTERSRGSTPHYNILSKSSTLTKNPGRKVWYSSDPHGSEREKYAFDPYVLWNVEAGNAKGLSSSGSNQAREGRLVNALAVRGDEGRDTLR